MWPIYMKIFLLSIIICFSQSLQIKSNDEEFLRKQELVFQLLWSTKVMPKNYPEVFERVKNYKIEDVAAACTNQNHVKEFEARLKEGMLARGQVFSPFREEHVNQVRSIFNVFYSAKNFNEFATMAAWSSLVINEITWLHAFAIAVAHRPDTKYIRLPNLYEIFPHYFFNIDVVMQAYRIKTGEVAGVGDEYTIDANYTGTFPPQHQDDEYKLSYYREDVGLNEFYFHFVSQFPFWMSSNDFKGRKKSRGELYYYVHRMLLNRYKLERLSHGLGEIEDVDWQQPILTGYYPRMTHFNGIELPTREAKTYVPVYKYKFVEEAKHYESRLLRGLDLGEFRTADSATRKADVSFFNDFCNALEGNADSPNLKFYGSLDRIYRRILGFAVESATKRRPVPSALEMSLTSLRDPGFYRMFKKIIGYGLRFKRNLPEYKREELDFPGVRIDYVHVDRFVTFMDVFESTLNHPRVLRLDDIRRQESTMPIVKARQRRLNHKPFAYQIGVSSEIATKAIVRIFLGPKHDNRNNEFDLAESFNDFYELDRWVADLKQGSSKLERSDLDSVFGVPDSLPGDAYLHLLDSALKTSGNGLVYHPRVFPGRLLLPRGTKSGLGLRLLVCLHPIDRTLPVRQGDDVVEDFAAMYLDDRVAGFPLDRSFNESSIFNSLRNFMIKDVHVYHVDVDSDDD